jgi:hypothetical protein
MNLERTGRHLQRGVPLSVRYHGLASGRYIDLRRGLSGFAAYSDNQGAVLRSSGNYDRKNQSQNQQANLNNARYHVGIVSQKRVKGTDAQSIVRVRRLRL